jgi:hypothetical protein
MVGSVPFRTLISKPDAKGTHVATINIDGKKYIGIGPNVRQATMAARKKAEEPPK